MERDVAVECFCVPFFNTSKMKCVLPPLYRGGGRNLRNTSKPTIKTKTIGMLRGQNVVFVVFLHKSVKD